MSTVLGSTNEGSPYEKIQATVEALGVKSLDEVPQGASELCTMLDRSQKIPLEAANAVKNAMGGDVSADVLTNVNTTKDLVGTTADVPLVSSIQGLKDKVDLGQTLEDGLKSIDDLLGNKDRSPSVQFFRAALKALGVNSLVEIPPNDSVEVRDILDPSQMTALDAANKVRTAVGGQEVDVITNVKSLMLKLAGANAVKNAMEGNAASDVLANVLGVNSLDKIPPNDSGEVRDILDRSQETALDAANKVKAAVGGQKFDVMTNVKSLMLKLSGANEVRTALEGNATSDFLPNVNT